MAIDGLSNYLGNPLFTVRAMTCCDGCDGVSGSGHNSAVDALGAASGAVSAVGHLLFSHRLLHESMLCEPSHQGWVVPPTESFQTQSGTSFG